MQKEVSRTNLLDAKNAEMPERPAEEAECRQGNRVKCMMQYVQHAAHLQRFLLNQETIDQFIAAIVIRLADRIPKLNGFHLRQRV